VAEAEEGAGARIEVEENGGEVGCGEERVGDQGERPLLLLDHPPPPPRRSAEEADEPEVGVTDEIDGNGSSFGGVDATLEGGGKGF
jgi:hypothetical protein